MNFGIDPNQPSTHRGALIATGVLLSVVFEWFGKPSGHVLEIFLGLAGMHGLAVKDQ